MSFHGIPILLDSLILSARYAYVPYSSLESVIEHSKEAYYLALQQTQGTVRSDAPDWQPWLMFFLRALAEQVTRLNKKVEREKLVLAVLPELSLQSSSSRVSMVVSRWVTPSSSRAAIATRSSSISVRWSSGAI
jgi:hypothetical protein